MKKRLYTGIGWLATKVGKRYAKRKLRSRRPRRA